MSINNQGFVDLPTSKHKHSENRCLKDQESCAVITEYTLLKVMKNCTLLYFRCTVIKHRKIHITPVNDCNPYRFIGINFLLQGGKCVPHFWEIPGFLDDDDENIKIVLTMILEGRT